MALEIASYIDPVRYARKLTAIPMPTGLKVSASTSKLLHTPDASLRLGSDGSSARKSASNQTKPAESGARTSLSPGSRFASTTQHFHYRTRAATLAAPTVRRGGTTPDFCPVALPRDSDRTGRPADRPS